MGAVATEISQWKEDDKYHEMKKYLLSEGGYWLREDKWMIESEAFEGGEIQKRTFGRFFSLYKRTYEDRNEVLSALQHEE